MKEIRVSTITPCFRMKPYLKKFLEELPQQTYFDNLEIVLDHNEPDQEEIRWVKEFSKKYPGKIKHIIVNPVESIGASMNRCIKEATGDFVTIWNVDDLRTPLSIESQVKAMLEKKGDIVMGNYSIVRSFGDRTVKKVFDHNNVPTSELVRSMYLGPFVMFKKTLCKKAGYFDEQLTSGADFDLSIRLAYNGKVVVADELLGYYLNEGKGASTRPGSKQLLERNVICLRYGIFDKLDLQNIPLSVTYSIPTIVSFGTTYSVSTFIDDYSKIINKNKNTIKKSILISSLSLLTGYQPIKNKIKSYIKNLLYPIK